MSDDRTNPGNPPYGTAPQPWYGNAPLAAPQVPPPSTPWPSAPVVPPPRTGPQPAPWAAPGWGPPPAPPGPLPGYGTGPMRVGPPPGWPPGGPPKPSSGAGKAVLIAAVVTVLVLLAGGGAFWWIRTQNASSASGTTALDTAAPTVDGGQAEATVVEPSFSEPEPTEPADTRTPEEQALDELAALRDQSRAGLVLDGRWVAQVASKSVGITDPMQTAQNGTHTFYAVDILAESEAARALAGSSRVLVLQGSDFGKISTGPGGQPFWVTLVDGGFASSDAVDAWCAQTYAHLSPAELANTCAARTLTQPHN